MNFNINQDLKLGDLTKQGTIIDIKRVRDNYFDREELEHYRQTYGLIGLSWNGNEIMTVILDNGNKKALEEKFIYEIKRI